MSSFNFDEVLHFYYNNEIIHRLQNLSIGIAGAGGIGSNCTQLLVRSGFSRFIIADFDQVSVSNLNRQTYSFNHIGQKKVMCLENICRSINPDLQITPCTLKVTSENIHTIFDSCDIIVEAFDNAESKALLFSSFLHSRKMVIGVSGIAGVGNAAGLKVRRIKNSIYVVGDEFSAVSNTLSPFAPRVVAASAIMADTVLEWVLSGTVSIV